MTRHEYEKLSAASQVIADQATRKEVWETAACDDLSEVAAKGYDPAALLARFDHWTEVGTTYFHGPPPLAGLIGHLKHLSDGHRVAGSACPLTALIDRYDRVSEICHTIFEQDAHEGHVVALMHDDRFALDRLTARVFLARRSEAGESIEETAHDVLSRVCAGLPRLCAPGR